MNEYEKYTIFLFMPMVYEKDLINSIFTFRSGDSTPLEVNRFFIAGFLRR